MSGPPPALAFDSSRWHVRALAARFLPLWWLLAFAAMAHGELTFSVAGGKATVTGYSGTVPSSINIPATYTAGTTTYPVTSIGTYALNNAYDLRSLTIPNSITTIGVGALSSCWRLTGITLPASVTSIGTGAFANCGAMTAIMVEAANPAYSSLNGVLFDKTQATLVRMPGGWAGEYVVPDGVTHIGATAFTSIRSLTKVTLPASVSQIGNSAFYSCFTLAVVEVEEANATYASLDGVLFDKTRTTLVQCPSGKWGHYDIPASVTSLAPSAFDHCGCLTGVTIPNGVTRIPNGTFASCEWLTSMVIPNSVTSMGLYPFIDCSGLTAIEVDTANSAYRSMDGVLFNKEMTTLIQYPGGKEGSYVIPVSVNFIGNAAFAYCGRLTGVTIPAKRHRHGISGVRPLREPGPRQSFR